MTMTIGKIIKIEIKNVSKQTIMTKSKFSEAIIENFEAFNIEKPG